MSMRTRQQPDAPRGLVARAQHRRALIARPPLPCLRTTSRLSRPYVAPAALAAIVAARRRFSRPARSLAPARSPASLALLPAAPPPGRVALRLCRTAPSRERRRGAAAARTHPRRRRARRRPRRHLSPSPHRYASLRRRRAGPPPRSPRCVATATAHVIVAHLNRAAV